MCVREIYSFERVYLFPMTGSAKITIDSPLNEKSTKPNIIIFF